MVPFTVFLNERLLNVHLRCPRNSRRKDTGDLGESCVLNLEDTQYNEVTSEGI